VDIIGVVSLVISGAAAVVSVMAWKAAQRAAKAAERQASAAERQADEAFRSVLDGQAVALHEAQAIAMGSVPRVDVTLEETYRDPCFLSPHGWTSETAGAPAPEKLDPLRTHRLDFLGKRFRGVIANHDAHPVTLIADRGLFVEGVSPRSPEPLGLPQAQSESTWVLGPGQAALLEWFGSCTVIDWYELARMPAGDASAGRAGVHVPYTVITVNRSGDQQWVPPALRITLEFDGLPVYLPARGPSSDGAAEPELRLLGGDGSGVGCDVRYKHPRVPKTFSDLTRAASPPAPWA
jgi:type II secretory pathway pseudopilin PulG